MKRRSDCIVEGTGRFSTFETFQFLKKRLHQRGTVNQSLDSPAFHPVNPPAFHPMAKTDKPAPTKKLSDKEANGILISCSNLSF
jgi:hypothetical protein